jgi:hypothetical protein
VEQCPERAVDQCRRLVEGERAHVAPAQVEVHAGRRCARTGLIEHRGRGVDTDHSATGGLGDGYGDSPVPHGEFHQRPVRLARECDVEGDVGRHMSRPLVVALRKCLVPAHLRRLARGGRTGRSNSGAAAPRHVARSAERCVGRSADDVDMSGVPGAVVSQVVPRALIVAWARRPRPGAGRVLGGGPWSRDVYTGSGRSPRVDAWLGWENYRALWWRWRTSPTRGTPVAGETVPAGCPRDHPVALFPASGERWTRGTECHPPFHGCRGPVDRSVRSAERGALRFRLRCWCGVGGGRPGWVRGRAGRRPSPG